MILCVNYIIRDLKEKLKNVQTRRERIKIENRIKKILKNAKDANKGSADWRGNKGSSGKGSHAYPPVSPKKKSWWQKIIDFFTTPHRNTNGLRHPKLHIG